MSQSNNAPQNTASASTTSFSRIPPSAPAGLITVVQPPASLTSYYKIAPSNLVTFAWNFSYVLATPTHLTVHAVCDNGNTYPVGPTNGVIDGTATSVVWDLYGYQQNNPNTPLAQATYTLNIWDDRGQGAGRAPGFLQPYSGLKFAMYTPEAYTSLADVSSGTGAEGDFGLWITNPYLAHDFG
ncbi:hypothetical protein C0995_000210 [Termitomyces sp. Mi166|nr:hypothetical protein C0995_000210 [Termitomyces sp. Mi166\